MLTKESMGPARREASFRMAELMVETEEKTEPSEFGEAMLIFRLMVWYDNVLLKKKLMLMKTRKTSCSKIEKQWNNKLFY